MAVVLATERVGGEAEAGPSTVLPYGDSSGTPTLLQRLIDQLVSLNVPDVHVVTRPDLAPQVRKRDCPEGAPEPGFTVVESDDVAGDLREVARLARAAKAPLVILHGDLVAGDELLTRLVSDAKTTTAAVAAEGTGPQVRVRGGRVESAGSDHHVVTAPTGVFLGLLRVAAADARALAGAADRLAALAGTPGTALGGDVPGLLLVGLARAGVQVAARDREVLAGARARTPAEAAAARAAVEAVDEDRARLAAAVKGNDGFFTTYAVSTYSWRIARLAARLRLTPNMVTSISMGVAVLAAVWFADGTRVGMLLGALLLYVAFVLDCVDGQLARYTRQFSTLGAWLDATFDRAKEYVVYAGLAVGSTAAATTSSVHAGDVWPLAVAALALQTCRHMIDFAFGASKRRIVAPLPQTRPLDEPGDGFEPAPPRRRRGPAGVVVALSNRTEKIHALRWAKKIIILPIGERFALISITAALFNAKVTFIALLGWGGLAAAYTLTGRLLRSLGR
ncbi:CDP-alcohol phosphatidyltransferase family protein [Actinomadura craniellae]|uniref:Bifunctional IPC transferase and DIPP synthase n=1 Tax=Actinomadura craniellae TaxID=2231787 RepID=A0A365H5B7_9ACTN|nr:CDP-alcohol phosphatidyltransferase family protein [Actinomadura craniellae]